jgi:hypothetical protein
MWRDPHYLAPDKFAEAGTTWQSEAAQRVKPAFRRPEFVL